MHLDNLMMNIQSATIRILFVCTFTLLIGCAQARGSITPGVIPKPNSVSAEDERYGHEVLSQLTKQFPLSNNDNEIRRVRNVVDRLTSSLPDNHSPWHVYVLNDSKIVNAAATKGQYVFVWSRMLETIVSDDELSTVLAHEIAHVLAGHTADNPSDEVQEMVTGVASTVARQVLATQGGLIGAAAGIAGALVDTAMRATLINPESKRKENEADQIGLFLMADSGYDPNYAVQFWTNLKNSPDSTDFGPLQFLSTHPSSDERIRNLKALLPEANRRFLKKQSGYLKNPDKDSFDIRNGNQDSFNVDKGYERNFAYVVSYTKAPVFEEPTASSNVIGILPYNTEILVNCRRDPWYKIVEPKVGFVHKKDIQSRSPFSENVTNCKY